MGRVCCWLPIGGGGLRHTCNNNPHNSHKCNSKVHFSHIIVFSVYFIIFRYKRAETQKNGRLSGVTFFQGVMLCRSVRQSRRSDGNFLSLAKKTIHF